MQAARDHQVKHEPQIVFDAESDALADAPQLAHLASFNAGDGRICGAQQERTRQSHVFERLADNARLERGHISRNVWEFGHEYRLHG
jgi:Ran GTPase-activating protein (RanGAP) involved in mRNA processing and transport